jgi:hypothetical protein
MTARLDDYVNPIAEGILSWQSISSYASDLEESLENWQKILHELSKRMLEYNGCAHFTIENITIVTQP